MYLFVNPRQSLLALAVILACQGLVVQAQRNITIPTPTSIAEEPNSSAAGNSSGSIVLSRNATSTASGNSTNTNSTRTSTSSQPDPTKPFATDFRTETYRVPAPAGPGGGNVAQSPDDSYIAKAERALAIGFVSTIAILASAAVILS